eukprot:TRINITY_DN8467_c0_g1_i1.p1 TRINITY_DN8467_c0_g1~~TRINITY_DN8467_c0_g1_i1.p1  ORF type:complete len:560 (-),score=89.71 TRINITY_DN8467_c0_g1_i1:178-1857(-)
MQPILPGQVLESGPEKVAASKNWQRERITKDLGLLKKKRAGRAWKIQQDASAEINSFKADMKALIESNSRELQKRCDELCRQHFEHASMKADKADSDHDYASEPDQRVTEVPRARRSVFKIGGSTGDVDHGDLQITMLRDAFLLTEEHYDELEKRKHLSMFARFRNLNRRSLEFLVDSIMLWIVGLNAIILGIIVDLPFDPSFTILDLVFTSLFILEFALKIILRGCREHFCGPSRIGNFFDITVIILDISSLILESMSIHFALKSSLLRLLRLGKLARLVRIFRLPLIQTFVTMIEGMMGGLTTLGWSIVLYAMILYVMALVYRELLGNDVKDVVYDNFKSVPRSMYTMFRCSFGDCSDATGVPIFEYVLTEYNYGVPYSISYCCVTFAITIGLFNVISANFVDSTLSASRRYADSRKQERLSNKILWSTRLTTLVRRLCECKTGQAPEHMSSAINMISTMSFEGSVLDQWVRDPEVMRALKDLDIDPQDFNDLSDILDPDQSGTIEVLELQEGLRRLRGFPRRSDILRVDLMVRSLGRKVNDMQSLLRTVKAASGDK